MKKVFSILIVMFLTDSVFGQTESFDVFLYQPPQFFTKSKLPSRIQFNLTNNDNSFCTITLHKSTTAKADIMKDVSNQWNELVVKRLAKADKIPAKIMTEQLWDGWISTLSIGNYYQRKKKCVVMMYSFRKDKTLTCALYQMSDKIFKDPVETFSKNLHLINKP